MVMARWVLVWMFKNPPEDIGPVGLRIDAIRLHCLNDDTHAAAR